jgi:hypothetical protein
MVANVLESSSAPASGTTVFDKMLNIFVCPGEVFDEVIGSAPALENWRVPTLLVCLAGMIQVFLVPGEPAVVALRQISAGAQVSDVQALELAGAQPLMSSLTVCMAAWVGTIWAAIVLWCIGRVILKVRFSFLKTLEIVGLSGITLVLGTVFTVLLVAATGNSAAHPSLSLIAEKMDLAPGLRRVLDVINFFHLWTATVLAGGLSRLAGVSFKEAAFWVFGYWIAARSLLILLG